METYSQLRLVLSSCLPAHLTVISKTELIEVEQCLILQGNGNDRGKAIFQSQDEVARVLIPGRAIWYTQAEVVHVLTTGETSRDHSNKHNKKRKKELSFAF